MAEHDSNSYFNPSRGTMYDSQIVEALHDRQELRIRDVQSKVSMQFDGLKRFAHDLWKVQRFEDLIFGRIVVPIDLINVYLKELTLPKKINGVRLATLASGDVIVTVDHKKYGNIILNVVLHEIAVNKDSMKIKLFLKSYEMPDVSWIMRNIIKLGLVFTGLEINALNNAMPLVQFKKGSLENEYEIDLTGIVKKTLDDNQLSMSMIRLIDWGVNDNVLGLQVSIKAQELTEYLKKRMPILFD